MHPLAQILRPYTSAGATYTARDLAILAYISGAESTARSVRHASDWLGIPKGNVSQTCNKLVGLGLVKRQQNLADLRSVVLTITAKGRAFLRQSEAAPLAAE